METLQHKIKFWDKYKDYLEYLECLKRNDIKAEITYDEYYEIFWRF